MNVIMYVASTRSTNQYHVLMTQNYFDIDVIGPAVRSRVGVNWGTCYPNLMLFVFTKPPTAVQKRRSGGDSL